MNTPFRAIDLALCIREALYEQFSTRRLQSIVDGKRTVREEEIVELASGVVPEIFPSLALKTVSSLLDLAAERPELMTQEPDDTQRLRFDYDILPLTPLRLLHANVLALAVQLCRAELVHVPRVYRLSGDSRRLYNLLQKRYVLCGYDHKGSIGIDDILREIFGKLDWTMTENARNQVHPLLEAGLAERGRCLAEVYHLTLSERYELIEHYQLASRWTTLEGKGEIETVQHAYASRSALKKISVE